jgi:hypothetical protein
MGDEIPSSVSTTNGIIAPAIPDRKRRCMSRRSGQNGRIEKKLPHASGIKIASYTLCTQNVLD